MGSEDWIQFDRVAWQELLSTESFLLDYCIEHSTSFENYSIHLPFVDWIFCFWCLFFELRFVFYNVFLIDSLCVCVTNIFKLKTKKSKTNNRNKVVGTPVRDFLNQIWSRKAHPKLGPHLLVAAHIKRTGKKGTFTLCLLPLLSLASSALRLEPNSSGFQSRLSKNPPGL